jgi:O-antigen/teichoic acid export membrane protein
MVTLLGKAMGAVVKFGTHVSLARLLGAPAYGIYAQAFAVTQIAELLALLGLNVGAVPVVAARLAARDERRLKGVLWQTISFPLVAGGIIGALLFAASGPLAAYLGEPDLAPVLRLFAIAIPLSASLTATVFATTGFQVTTYFSAIWEFLLPLANLALVLVLCGAGLGLPGAVTAWIGAVTVALTLAVGAAWRLFPPLFSRRVSAVYERAAVLRRSIPLGLGDLAWVMILWTDVLVLGFFQPPGEVGAYRAASQLALLLVLFLASLNSISGPLVAAAYQRHDIPGMRDTLRTATRWSLTLTLPIFVVLCVAGADFLQVFGPDFTHAALPLAILAGGHLLNAAAAGIWNVLAASGRGAAKLSVDVTCAVLTVLLNVLLVPIWGAVGAAVATALSIACLSGGYVFCTYSIFGIHPYARGLLKPLLAGAGALAAAWVVEAWIDGEHFVVSLVAVSVTVVVTYGAALLALGVESTDRQLAQAFRQRYLSRA